MTPQIYENAQARPEHHLFAWTLPCEMLERRTYVSAKIAFVMLLLDVHLADTAVPLPCSVIPSCHTVRRHRTSALLHFVLQYGFASIRAQSNRLRML